MDQAFLESKQHAPSLRAEARKEDGLWQSGSFWRFLLSENIRSIGQMFLTIALPWYVMSITGSTAAMGLAILLAGAPRVAFTVLGGALTDRFSPQVLLTRVNLLRAALIAGFTWAVWTGHTSLWLLYGMNFAIGLTDAVLVPAGGAFLPQLVSSKNLKTANSVVAAQGQVWGLVGPATAGVLLTQVSKVKDLPGLLVPGVTLAAGLAFAINAVSLALTAWLLLSIARPTHLPPFTEHSSAPASKGAIKELLAFVWRHAGLRGSLGMLYFVNIISNGPLWVGLPVLAVSRFPEGAQAMGLLTSALGCGALLGSALAGLLPQSVSRPAGWIIPCGLIAGLALLAGAAAIHTAMIAVLAVSGIASFVNVTEVTRIQRITPPVYLGRMMGLLNLK